MPPTERVIMRAFIFAGLIALAAAKGVPKSKFTALARGGGRIVGGEDASYGEFPHQIMLLRGGPDGSLMCGGSLVSSNMVVTAGHCCDGQSARRLGVAVGSHKLHSMDSDQENIQVSRVILHEDYDSFNILNDICLLELESAATMGAHGGGALKLQQADVVQDVEGVVVLVEDDPGDLDVLLVGVHAVQLVGADGNAQTAGGLSVTAVPGG